MDKEESLLRKRFLDLAERAYKQNIYTYTAFLSPADQTLLMDMEQELSFIPWRLFGGMEDCERRMAAFGGEEVFGYTEAFPIACIRFSPLQKRFAEPLGHRDFLGALMNQGIERAVLGDIIIKDLDAYVFCMDSMKAMLLENVSRIRHTSVKGVLLSEVPELLKPVYVARQETVASLRIDVIVASVYHLSRSRTGTLFMEQKVSLNGRSHGNHSYMLKAGDTVSVRGYGRFIFSRTLGETKKGRLLVELMEPEQNG